MSEGPIKREREATTVPRVSIPNNQRLCTWQGAVLYKSACGRKGTPLTTADLANCPDCLAAIRADAPLPAPLENQ